MSVASAQAASTPAEHAAKLLGDERLEDLPEEVVAVTEALSGVRHRRRGGPRPGSRPGLVDQGGHGDGAGTGLGVDKVTEATRTARERRPDLPIDGPLQYDAAAVASVASSKRPGSPVAGRATVFVFPDLNTGNTTYKTVQRSADVVSIGPMLQDLANPVDDLSRGTSVEDIVYTIALTAIQSTPDRPAPTPAPTRRR